MCPAETAELIEMPFEWLILVGSRNRVLDGGRDVPQEGAILGR